jgi:hypothetical protein
MAKIQTPPKVGGIIMGTMASRPKTLEDESGKGESVGMVITGRELREVRVLKVCPPNVTLHIQGDCCGPLTVAISSVARIRG